MKKVIYFLFLFTALNAEITVKVSREVVKLNESIQVVFKSDQKIKNQPDFKPLEKNFEILSQHQSNSTRIINGHVENDYSWTFNLMSKKEGQVVIPSIRFGTFQSQPVTIEVTEAQATTKGDPLFFEVSLSPANAAYEQSQLLYTVRFFRSVNLYNGHLSDIAVSDPDAIIEPIGEDKEYDQIINGVRYLVIERKYAVFPQHAGELTFAPIRFEGQIVTGGRSIFNMQTQHTVLHSESLKIDVRPIPPPFTRQNWLAAEQVKLVDEWSGDIGKVKAGEPITRTVTILADGCLGSQIPNINIPLPENLKQYPDKPQAYNQPASTNYTGAKQIKIALIASEQGIITVPEVQVNWWDVKAGKMRTTSLPSLELHITSDQVAPATPSPAEIQQLEIKQTIPIWAWILIGLNGVWLAALLTFLLKKKSKTKLIENDPTLSQIKQSLKQACTSHDPKKAEKALLAWAKIAFPMAPLNLANLADCLTGDLKEEVEDLNESLYSPNNLWNGKELWEAFTNFKAEKPKLLKEVTSDLKELYS